MSGMDIEGQFTFAGWDYEITKVNGHATYKATYTGTIIDLWNCEIENGGIDGLTYDTSAVNGESNRSLKVSEPITKGNLPNLAIVLDKTYDLTNKYVVFDINFTKDGWLFGFDFVNDGKKNTPWNMHTIKKGETSPSHKCEDLENGWVRVYVDASALSASTNKVSKIYFTLNASDGEGTLEFNLDNLHFEEKIDRIDDCDLVVVNGGTFTYDSVNGYAVANVPENNSGVWWNYDVDLTALLGKGLNLDGKTITFDVKIVGNMTWVGFTVADGYGSYFKPNDEDYAWMSLSNGWSGFDMTVTAIEDGWFRVLLAPSSTFASVKENVGKLRFLVNPQDANEASFLIDNLYLSELVGYVEPEKIDEIDKCGLVAVNGGTFAYDSVNGYAVANVPENNSGVYWNYDVDLTKLLDKGLNLDGKTITFDVKIVGNMTWVGFTVADGYGSYVKPNDEDYAWMNLSNGWSGFDMTITAIEDGWFRVSLAPSSTFASVKENVGKLRFLVNPQDANEASFLIDNLYLGELVGYVEPAKTDIIDECGLVAVNGGTFAYDSANGYAVATVPANNSGVYWNYDIGLTDITDEAVNLSGKTISFDVKIVGNMTWVGFTVGYGNGNYAQVNNEGYAWTNLSDKWSGFGMSINALEDGWFRVTVTIDESFSSVSSNITELRFLVSPQDTNEATFSVDNLYL